MANLVPKTFDIDHLLYLIDEGYDRDSWHGPPLLASMKGLTPKMAVWKPRASRKNIAEIVLHCAYWKNRVRKKIERFRRNDFPLRGKNWFPVPEKLSTADWKRHRTILDTEHKLLRKAIAKTPVEKLFSSRQKKENPVGDLVGIPMHDVYHAGQIRTLKSQMTN